MDIWRKSALSQTVIKLGIISFFADVSSEMLYPITPIFLTATLGASMVSVGLTEGFAEAMASLFKAYGGVWSDRTGKRRVFITAGYFIAAISKPLIGFSSSWTHVFFARGLDRSGKGIRNAPRDALLSDSIDADSQGEAFGWHRLMDTMGAIIGPLIAVLFLAASPHSLRSLYFWALIPGLLAVLITFFIKESTSKKPTSTQAVKKPARDVLRNSGFKTYFLGWTLFSLTNSSDVFLILRTKQSGVSLSTTIFLYCFYNVVYALSSPYLGRLSDQMKRKYVLMGGLFVFALVYLGFSQAIQLWQFWLLFGVYGLYMGATDGVGKALAVDLVPAELKATGVGVLGAVTGVSTVFASFVAGLLWDHYGSAATFVYGAIGALMGVLVLGFLKEYYPS